VIEKAVGSVESGGFGMIIVAAAGNGGASGPYYPAGYHDLPGVISVSALSATGANLAAFSNYQGKIASSGTDVVSDFLTMNGKVTYGIFSGTSPATTSVAATVAAVWGRYGIETPEQINSVLQASVDQTELLKIQTLWGGRLNAGRALQYARHHRF
jgi:subtilisin family serine protease